MNISFGSGLTQIFLSWASFKATTLSKVLSPQYVQDDQKYIIFGLEHGVAYFTEIYKTTVPENVDSTTNAASLTDFESNYKSKYNKTIAPQTADGRPLSASAKSDATKKNFFSHDWTDPTTWYEQSVKIVDEVAVDSGDQLTYNLSHVNVIDSYHGKLYQEDFLKSAAGNTLRVGVKVNNVAKAEQNPHFGVGGDFVVNYKDGKIVFLSALATNDEVKATYSYATNSRFTIKPDAGKTLMIDLAEVQFSEDVVMTDSVKFQPYGYVDVFAPQYLQSNGGPYPSLSLIPLGNPLVYKSMTDFQAEATKSFPVYPALGGPGWRGTPSGIVVFDWDYVSATVLRSDYGMEVRMFLEHDTPFDGWYGTATFYCTSQ